MDMEMIALDIYSHYIRATDEAVKANLLHWAKVLGLQNYILDWMYADDIAA